MHGGSKYDVYKGPNTIKGVEITLATLAMASEIFDWRV